MDIATITGESRQPGGRHANERLRRRGMVPAVVYGHGEKPETVALSRHELDLALARLAHVIRLRVDGRDAQYLIKDVQYDHLQAAPLHVDLMRVDAGERVSVKVAIELKGTPRGVREGGVIHHMLADLEIECPVLEIPETLRVNVDDLGIGQALHVRDVALPPNVRALTDADALVVAVRHKREEVAAAPAAAAAEGESAAEPEVIGRVAKETPEEESGK